MRLKKYQKNNNKKIIISLTIISLLFISLFIYQSYANYQMKATFKLINGKLKLTNTNADIELAFYKGNQKVDDLPLKDNEEGLNYFAATCTNNAKIRWNNDTWTPTIYNLSKTKTSCTLYFGTDEDKACIFNPNSAVCKYYKNGEQDNLIYDETADKNLRFTGQNPNNYINFNDDVYETDIYHGYKLANSWSSGSGPSPFHYHFYKVFTNYEDCTKDSEYHYYCDKVHSKGDAMWRIIGIMNNVEDENGNLGSYIKIIRDDIGIYVWDTSESSINTGYGINEWSQAKAMRLLNNEYLNKQNTENKCYDYDNNREKECPNWEEIGIKESAREMIANINWPIGSFLNTDTLNVQNLYQYERGIHLGKETCSTSKYCNDDITRTTNWIGKIALPYPSDYLYAVAKEYQSSCLTTLNKYSSSCTKNNYLSNTTDAAFTLTSNTNSGYAIMYICLDDYNSYCLISSTNASNSMHIRPTLYLKQTVEIEEDESEDYGSITNPLRIKKQ